jgi:hypothetical protein
MDRWLEKVKEGDKDYIAKHDTLDGFDMDKDYTKDYPQEDVLSLDGIPGVVPALVPGFQG